MDDLAFLDSTDTYCGCQVGMPVVCWSKLSTTSSHGKYECSGCGAVSDCVAFAVYRARIWDIELVRP